MSQPGWYADPRGQGLRWWDGVRWTDHRAPTSAPAPPHAVPSHGEHGRFGGQPVQPPPPPPSPPPPPQVVEGIVHGVPLRADAGGLGYGSASMPWEHATWVAYWSAAVPSQGPPDTAWIFQMGSVPLGHGPHLEIVFDRGGTGDPRGLWERVVEQCRGHAEGRIIARLAERVRAGDTVDVAHGIAVHPGGVRGNRVSLSWSAVSGAVVDEGRVLVQQTRGAASVLFVPQQNPNAVLLPGLLAVLKQGR